MTAPQKIQSTVALGSSDGLGSIQVNALEFERFEETLTLRVATLIQQWKHVASPNAQRKSQRRTSSGPQPTKE